MKKWMITIAAILAATMAMAADGGAAELKLRWTYPETTIVDKFVIYYGTEPFTLTETLEVADPALREATVTGLDPGTVYFFRAKAVRGAEESYFSPGVYAKPPLSPPAELQVLDGKEE